MRSKTFKAKKALIAGTVASLAMSVSFVNVMAVPMDVTATVAAVCQIDSTADVAFGGITPGSAPNYDASGSVTWRCTNLTPADIAIDGGGTGDIANRAMAGAPGSLTYQLYTPGPPTFTTVWGDGITGSLWGVVGSGMGIPQQQTTLIDGRVLDADTLLLQPGGFTDTVDVTITP